ncbi:MAG: hypothetical protein JEZ04_03815 [Spirochaetales bacterium]|nr:hypothetical protein [Spirochaetales bacterium]
MKKIKLTAILLTTALILALTACGGMITATDNVGIDLSGVLSKAVGSNINTVRVWLVADGTNNFVELDQSEFTVSSTDSTITLLNIPVGPTYTIYLSLGTKSGEVFTAVQTANGSISVAAGVDNSLSITAAALKTANPTLTGKNIKAVLHTGGTTYAIDAGNLYYGATTKPAGSGYTFNDLDLGINGDIFLSANATDGRAIIKFDGVTLDPSYSTALPASEGISAPINILSSEIFYTTEEADDVQVIISQLNAGFVINVFDETKDPDTNDWTPIDLDEMLSAVAAEAPGLNLSGELIRGISIIEKEADSVWIYLCTKLGNFRKVVSWAADATVGDDFGQDFITDSVLLSDKLILAIDNMAGTDYLFIGTDNGLFKATVPDDSTVFPITAETAIAATAGKRVELIAAGPTYTACVTALNLIIIDSSNKASKIAFNEGLPATGLLNGNEGITGLEWKDGNTLIVSGSNGLVEVAANTLTYN